MMGVSKDIFVLLDKKQKPNVMDSCNYIFNCFLTNCQVSFSLFSRPVCRDGWRPDILATLDYDVFNNATENDAVTSATQTVIISKNGGGRESPITTRARGYGWSAPIIFEPITESSGAFLSISGKKVVVGVDGLQSSLG
jgi:hypothetical protein